MFYPLAWLIGVDNQDLTRVGRLLGVKSIVNEFIAYSELRDMEAGIPYTINIKWWLLKGGPDVVKDGPYL